jgi:hypothetical protein
MEDSEPQSDMTRREQNASPGLSNGEWIGLGALLLAAMGILFVAFPLLGVFWGGILGLGPMAIFGLAWYYYHILDAGTEATARYKALRQRLTDGESAGQFYERAIGGMLDRIDRFYGDNATQQPELSRWLRLDKDARLWTAASYDRSLLIAFLYPLLICFLLWAATGQVGVAETALGLRADAPAWQRALLALTLIAGFFTLWRAGKFDDKPLLKLTIMALTLFGIMASVRAFAGAVVSAFAFAVAGVVSGAFTVAGAVAGAVAFAGAFAGAGLFAFAFAFAVAAAVLFLLNFARQGGQWSWFLLALTLILLAICFTAPLWLISDRWSDAAPLLLFFGLFTLINAPFDWLTLGVTRALIRAGLVPGRTIMHIPGALIFGIVDLVLALVFLLALAIAIVFAVQLFGALEIIGGAPRQTLAVEPVLAALADPQRRFDWPYMWIYFMVFSTMVPSLINLAVGCFAWLRGFAPLDRWAAAVMERGPKEGERLRLALWLGAQPVIGVVVGLLLIVYPAQTLMFGFGPTYGEGMISLVQDFAAANWPERLIAMLS